MVLDSAFADLKQLAGVRSCVWDCVLLGFASTHIPPSLGSQEMVEMGKGEAGFKVPGFVIKAATKMVQSSVLKKSGLDMFKLKPIANVDKYVVTLSCPLLVCSSLPRSSASSTLWLRAFVPALFIAGENDEFIRPHHSQAMYAVSRVLIPIVPDPSLPLYQRGSHRHDKYAGDKNIIVVPGGHNSERPRFCMDAISLFLREYMCIPAEVRVCAGAGGAMFEDTSVPDRLCCGRLGMAHRSDCRQAPACARRGVVGPLLHESTWRRR